jgi:hypothetical protein
MSRRFRPLVLVAVPLLILSVPVLGEGFLTEKEIALVDDALALLNMTREDASFDKLVLTDDWRLDVVDRTLSRPLEAPDVVAGWAETVRGERPVRAALLAAARDLGLSVGAPDEALRPRFHLDEAEERIGRAFADLTKEDREALRRWAYALLLEEHDGLVPRPERSLSPEEGLALAAKVDRAMLIEAALQLTCLADDLPDLVTADLATHIVVGGRGDDVHDLSVDAPTVLLELGGNDRYVAPGRATADRPLAIVIDLGGDDVYGAGESLSGGAGFFGVGVIWDRGDGDDVYRGGHLSQGCGLFGVGLVIDEGGSDTYQCRDTGQGAGAFGVGLLIDLGEGNDRYHADLFGQGFAYVGGLGLLYNQAGQDVYEAGGVHLHYPLFNDRYQSLSQGFSIGMRPYASGGVGLLIDDAGNDRYACDIYGQGASYWFAYGGLLDRGGNDTYTLGQYGQGGGIHLAVGCLLDLAGQDLYYNMHGVGTGGAHDWAVGILVDRAGDDYYAGSGGTMGGSLTNSFALLLDGGGDDGYSAVKVRHAVGGGRSARGMGSIGLLIDRVGKDLHGTREANGTVWTKETYGAGIDLADPPPVPGAKPPRRAALTPEEAEKRVCDEALVEAEGGKRWDLDKLWEISCRWAVGEMADVVPVAKKHLYTLGEPALERALSRVATRSGLEMRAVKDTVKHFGAKAVPPLVAMLEDEDAATRSRAASLLADLGAKEATPKIVALLAGERTRLGALDALARLEARDAWREVGALLADPKERVRVAAARCLQKLEAAEAVPVLVARIAAGDFFTVRFACEDVLVSLGEPAIPDLMILARDGGTPEAQRHGIRALGRLGAPEALDLLAALGDHADWRIRFEAVGALGAHVEKAGPSAASARSLLRDLVPGESHPYVKSRLTGVLAR